jgi:hypothetical protein
MARPTIARPSASVAGIASLAYSSANLWSNGSASARRPPANEKLRKLDDGRVSPAQARSVPLAGRAGGAPRRPCPGPLRISPRSATETGDAESGGWRHAACRRVSFRVGETTRLQHHAGESERRRSGSRELRLRARYATGSVRAIPMHKAAESRAIIRQLTSTTPEIDRQDASARKRQEVQSHSSMGTWSVPGSTAPVSRLSDNDISIASSPSW